MDQEWTFAPHLPEETLEEYCFDRLSATETAEVEEHLLVCSSCQLALEELDDYIRLMKAATASLEIPSLESAESEPSAIAAEQSR